MHAPNTEYDLPPLYLPIILEEDISDVGNTTHVMLPPVPTDIPIGIGGEVPSTLVQDSPRTSSYKKHGLPRQPYKKKHSLIDIKSMANAISEFAAESSHT